MVSKTTNKVNLEYAKEFAIGTAKAAGKSLMNNFNKIKTIKTKTEGNEQLTSLVSNADIEAERIIINKIKKHYPEHNIVSEEEGSIDNKSAYSWYIDPLDGTHNYIYGNPLFNVSIALVKDGQSIAGVVYLPYFNELFYAVKGRGAYSVIKGKKTKLKPSNKRDFKECMMIFSSSFYLKKHRVHRVFKKLTKLAFRTRIHGAAAMDLTYVASGRADFSVAFDFKPWDIAAGALIAEEAGAKVTCLDGNSWNPKICDIVASNSRLYSKLIKVLKDE